MLRHFSGHLISVLYLFEIDHRIFLVVEMNVRELYHQVEEVRIPLLFLVDHLNLPKSETIQPVDLHHVTIVMLLAQLLGDIKQGGKTAFSIFILNTLEL